MTPAFRSAVLWIIASVVMYMAAMSSISAAFINGHYLPANEDAFYHARRVLDALMNHAAVIQFDPKIHAPEGSWLNWPWGFDTLMVKIAGLFGPYPDIDHANRVLMNIPPLMCTVGVLLVVSIGRQLSLPMLYRVVFALAFALLPAAFGAFAVGNVDHHFAELLCTLGVWSAGIWFVGAADRSPAAAVTLGLVLGGAIALQNGLFVLQVPICLFLALRWLQKQPLPAKRHMIAFGLTLFFATLLVCIPSEPWRRGFFEFYTLSWFHLYVAAIVAAFSVLLAYLRFTHRNLLIVGALAIAAVAPLVSSLRLATEFVTGSLEIISNISEASSPYALFLEPGETESTMYMSWWLVLMLPMTLLNLAWAWRRRDPVMQLVAVLSVFGLVLFQFQYRFAMFGLVPMLLTPLLAALALAEARPRWRRVVPVAALVVFTVVFIPTARSWHATYALGGQLSYGNILGIWPRFQQLCQERPGLVLTDIEAGHWVRYHTDCSVIANVFLLTPQHAAKVRETTQLMSMSPRQLLDAREDVRYVLVFHGVSIEHAPDGGETPVLETLRQQLAPLERSLLGPDGEIPDQFKIRWEIRSPQGQTYARLFEIVRD